MSDESQASSRRNFLMRMGIALNVVAASLIAVPVVGYIAAAMRKRSYQAWVKLGDMSQFPAGETRLATYQNPFTVPWDGKTSNVACWVRNTGANKMQVFAVNCAHLGCPVRWFPESKLFMCPCHGGVYYEYGSLASGPPPRGLLEDEYEVRGDELWIRYEQMPTLANPVGR